MNRRHFLQITAGAYSIARAEGAFGADRIGGQAPAIITRDSARPQMPSGVQSGDVTVNRAIVWSRTDRPARLIVEWATNDAFRDARRVEGPMATPSTDFTAQVDLADLPAGEQIVYRAFFESLTDRTGISEALVGRLRTPSPERRDVLITWSGDTVGQGFGINPDIGGFKLYEAMDALNPDLFIHSGDLIYADGPLQAEVKLDEGRVWKNIVTPAKSKVCETLDEFRGAFAYNLLDAHMRRFNARTPMIAQWDDHETRNNWFPGQILDDERYRVKEASVLAARAKQATFEYTPIRRSKADPQRIYRSYRYGPALEIFMLDERSYRGRNTANRQESMAGDAAMLGGAQLTWLKNALAASPCTWKVIASDQPIGLIVPDVQRDGVIETYEAFANGDGPALGRELEIANLLRFIKARRIRNTVWITADVHYGAAHHYDPTRAVFTDFDPFWEFVAGPLNAGTFPPNALDNTFGPQVKYSAVARDMRPNRSPLDGFQFFGAIKVDGATGAMTVSIRNLRGETLYLVGLEPIR